MTRVSAPWLGAPPTRAVLAALSARGHRLYFVGGCVRNALLDVPVTDIDIATEARPEAVIEMAEAAKLKAVPTGIAHGTVTVVSDGHPFEVTTFRRDVETDGRRAVVAFADTVAEDAARRDFTMNALYCDAEGRVIDPVGGLTDLALRRFRFIGEPGARIREDYLRILRFFRFHAQHGDPTAGLDPMGLAAVAAHRDGLAGLSRERVGAEMKKLLTAEDPAPAVIAMAETGVLERVLPDALPDLMPALVSVERALGADPDWVRRLVALGGGDRSAALRLSRHDSRAATSLAEVLASGQDMAEAAYRHGRKVAENAALIRAARTGDLPPEGWRACLDAAAVAVFPVAAADLVEQHPPGPALGAALRQLEDRWIASGFTLDRAALLSAKAG